MQCFGDETAPDSGFTSWPASTHNTGSASSFRRPHPRLAAYAAFFAMVVACLAAAATLVGNDLPLLLGAL